MMGIFKISAFVFRHHLVCVVWATIGLSTGLVVGCGPDKPFPKYVPSEEEIAWQVCNDRADAREFEVALECYGKLCEGDPVSKRACHDRTKMLFELDRVEEARKASLDFVRNHPESGLAPVALKRLGKSFERTGESESGIVELEALALEVAGTDVHDTVLYQIASLYRGLGRLEEESAKLKELTKAYGRWESQLWDNAMWRRIQLEGEFENTKKEISLIKRFLEEQESSWILGSYDSPYFDDAKLRYGYIRLERGDSKRAYRTFRDLASDKESRLRDDALFGAAKAKLAMEDEKGACKVLATLFSIKDANTKRDAVELASSIGCDLSD